jgi:16S rRNA (adenine(1408)-N(1))-methyltransferase
VLAEAAAEPTVLVIGVDAVASAMAEASRRAAKPTVRGGRTNAVFLAAGVEMLPAGLAGVADRVTVRFPWGSLLRGALGLDGPAAEAMAALVAPGGSLELTLSIAERDGIVGRAGPFGSRDLARLGGTFRALGLRITDVRALDGSELRRLGSSWAGRLGAGDARQVWGIRLERGRSPAAARALS